MEYNAFIIISCKAVGCGYRAKIPYILSMCTPSIETWRQVLDAVFCVWFGVTGTQGVEHFDQMPPQNMFSIYKVEVSVSVDLRVRARALVASPLS